VGKGVDVAVPGSADGQGWRRKDGDVEEKMRKESPRCGDSRGSLHENSQC
jgi:hypothetical protein